MTISCNELDTLLMEGDPASMTSAIDHARACEACTRTLADWKEISDVAGEMRATWTNDLLWPRIERALADDGRHQARWWQIAAAVMLIAGLGAAVWFAQQQVSSPFDRAILRASVVDEVERTERAHQEAIQHMEKLAESKLDVPATPLMVNYKEKLMLLDDAIAECQTNIDRNQHNAYLRKQLLTIYSEKQQTLREVLREENHVSNQ